MNFSTIKHLASATLLLLLAACSRTAVYESKGWLDVSVNKNTDVDCVFTRADEGDDDVIALTIYGSIGEEVWSCTDCSTITDAISLDAGVYTAVATSGTDGGGAAFDSPFYSCTQDFSIIGDETTTLNLTLTLATVKVTAEFSEDFDTYFTSYVLTVSNGVNSLEFSEEDGTLDSEGYFSVTGTLTYTLDLVNTDGQEYSLTKSYTDVCANQYYAFVFSIESYPDEYDGAGELIITVDDSLNEKDHEFVIYISDNPPTVDSSSSYNPTSSLTIVAGDDTERILVLDMKSGATSLIISHSDDGLTSAGVPTETELVGAGDDDIAALSAAGIETTALTTEDTEATIDFTALFSSLPIGSYTFTIYAENSSEASTTLTAVVEVTSATTAVSANAWARFATLTGQWNTSSQPDGVGFEYRTADGEWTVVSDTYLTIDESTSTFTAELRGLTAETEYEFRTVCATGSEDSLIAFTTEAEEDVPNLDFDDWYQNGSIWYPNADETIYWDTANEGSSLAGVYPTTREGDYLAVEGDGKYAARLESSYALVAFAAGNIYTGDFGSAKISLSNPGATLDWGQPFTGRPLALKGYYDYRPAAIDYTKSPYTDLEGTDDIGQIQIMLTSWDEPFTIDTPNSVFVDTSDSAILAYGTMDLNETSEYTEFTITIDWRDTETTPTYIVIVGASSKYGDYFTGGKGSVLYLDEFSLVYDPDELDD